MREYGLIGYPLKHAFSRTYFQEKFVRESINDSKYQLFSLSDISKLQRILEAHPNLYGINVTTPYKELVIPFLTEIDPVALSIGAVNTIAINHRSGGLCLKGYNTDHFGFRKLLEGIDLPKKALILGSGGSGKTVRYVLKSLGIECLTATRYPKFDDQVGYNELDKQIILNNTLIVNCTPIGMYPNVDAKPDIPYEYISKNHICIDLIYNPEVSSFLQNSKDQGAFIRNGFDMLVSQAESAWEIWEKECIESKVPFISSSR